MTRLDLINEPLRHEDIEGLLAMGAPDDEYESEAEMIAAHIGEAEENAPDQRITREEAARIVSTFGKRGLACPTRVHERGRKPFR
jgi:hypothetical protein